MHSVNFFSPFLLGIFSVFTILIGVFLKEKYAKIFAILISVIGIIASFVPLSIRLNQEALVANPAPILFISWAYHFLLAVITISSIIIIASDKRSSVNRFEIYPILLLSLSGMLFAVFTENIIGLYLGLELTSIAGYIIASLNKEDAKSNEASMKYFVIGAVSSCLMIYGISLIYGFSGGNFNISEVDFSILDANKFGLTIGFLLFACGLFFKTTTFPFHVWAPDVYSGINTSSLSFLSIAPKITAFFVLFKILIFQLPHIAFTMNIFQTIIGVLAGISMIIGAVGAIRQTSIKKILAYSGIVHMGFVMALFSAEYKILLGFSVIYYFLIYTFINIGIFAILASLKQNPAYTGNINDLKGLHKSNPVLGFSLSVLMFSSAGIPPLAGFFVKYSVLAILIQNENHSLAIIAVIASVIASFYYLRIIKNIYFDEASEAFIATSKNTINIFLKFLILISILGNLIFVYI
jgi:NADH-quinone oxidoreductase subunit N